MMEIKMSNYKFQLLITKAAKKVFFEYGFDNVVIIYA